MYEEVLKPVFTILSSVTGGALVYASLMALFLTENEEADDEKPTGWDWKVWVDLWTPVFTSYHSMSNFRRNWWSMRGPSILILVGAAFLLISLVLMVFT